MSADRDIERILDRWFAQGPTEVADRVIGAALATIDSTPQRHVSRVSRTYPSMTRFMRLAAAAVMVAVATGVALAVLRPAAAPPVGTLGSPSPTATPAATGSANAATAVDAGNRFTCAITTGGRVRCWGSNNRGQLGNGTTTDSGTPVDVQGLTSGVRDIATGYEHACALTNQGAVRCWGRNDGGQLGNGTSNESHVPVDVTGLTSGVTAIEAGSGWFCAITGGGGVKCWGWYEGGKVGPGDPTSVSTPVDVEGLTSGVTAIASGSRHTCAIMNTGGVKCFGLNAWGELGDGSLTRSMTPVDVAGLPGSVTAITAGDFYTCALLGGGGVTCWGYNNHGQLGNGTTIDSTTPVDVSGLAAGVRAVDATGSDAPYNATHTCALMTAGGVRCWGRNDTGELGNGTTTESSIPVDVSGLPGAASAITVGGGGHTCALMTTGGVLCWGNNDAGQLGDGTTTNSTTPVVVAGL